MLSVGFGTAAWPGVSVDVRSVCGDAHTALLLLHLLSLFNLTHSHPPLPRLPAGTDAPSLHTHTHAHTHTHTHTHIPTQGERERERVWGKPRWEGGDEAEA